MASMTPRIVVLKGGPSDEYALSMRHGREVAEVLRSQGSFNVTEVTIAKTGEWLQDGIGRESQAILEAADGVYIALHGLFGEDGSLQRILERHGVRYNGSRPYQSSIGLNKMLTKESFSSASVLQAPHLRVTREGVTDVATIAHTIVSLFGPKYILKPLFGGSGLGTRYAESAIQLTQAMRSMFELYDDVLVEQYIEGIDATCGVIEGLRDQKLYTTPVVEIAQSPDGSVFSAEKVAPGRFTKAIKDTITQAATEAHTGLCLQQLSRSDFRITPAGDVYFLETNTLPAATTDSPLMAGLQSLGVSQEELICHLCGQVINP